MLAVPQEVLGRWVSFQLRRTVSLVGGWGAAGMLCALRREVLHRHRVTVRNECHNRVSANDVQERYWFCTAPATLHDTDSAAELLRFASSFAARQPVLLDVSRAGSVRVPNTAEQLRTLETRHNVCTISLLYPLY